MANTVPLKSVTFTKEDVYRKDKMIAYLKSRGMLTESTERYIKQGDARWKRH